MIIGSLTPGKLICIKPNDLVFNEVFGWKELKNEIEDLEALVNVICVDFNVNEKEIYGVYIKNWRPQYSHRSENDFFDFPLTEFDIEDDKRWIEVLYENKYYIFSTEENNIIVI
jgi:hypothetical protein